MAPPLTLTLFISQSSSLETAKDWAAKASFASIKSSSSIDHLASSKAFFTAGTGPIPIIEGSTPIVEDDTILTSGLSPNSLAFSFFITNTAAAPSFNPDAFPAVTVPSLSKTGFKELNLSKVVPCLGNSSVSNNISSFLMKLLLELFHF